MYCTYVQIDQAKAVAASDKLTAERDFAQSRRRVESLEAELLALTSGEDIPEAVKLEVSRRGDLEKKLFAAEEKYIKLMDKCDVGIQYFVNYVNHFK